MWENKTQLLIVVPHPDLPQNLQTILQKGQTNAKTSE